MKGGLSFAIGCGKIIPVMLGIIAQHEAVMLGIIAQHEVNIAMNVGQLHTKWCATVPLEGVPHCVHQLEAHHQHNTLQVIGDVHKVNTLQTSETRPCFHNLS